MGTIKDRNGKDLTESFPDILCVGGEEEEYLRGNDEHLYLININPQRTEDCLSSLLSPCDSDKIV